MKIVRFNQAWAKWMGGEVAGFADAEAAELVKSGVADYHDPGTEKQRKPPADKQMRPGKRRVVTKG